MLPLFFSAVGQVALVAIVLGGGLPALFALGVRSFALASPDTTGRPAGSPSGPPLPAPLLQLIGAVCFLVVVLAVVAGLSIIIGSGLGQTVSFDHVIPTFTPKG